MALLKVTDLRTWFHTRDGVVRAVDGISFQVEAGQTLGIVGESGSGKSVTAASLIGLVPCPPGRVEAREALFGGRDLLGGTAAEQRAIRGRDIGMVFQDPMTALNPYMKVGDQVAEALRVHGRLTKPVARAHALEALRETGISDPEQRLSAWPHEFSGGMRQRVMIAMALVMRPRLLIADEPTTALDVTVQAQILQVIKRLQTDHGMAMILITHDLGVVASACDQVAVMYAGRIVEAAPVEALFAAPKHPYTAALMASIPSAQRPGKDLYTIPGAPPDLRDTFAGCPFAPRCDFAIDSCLTQQPALVPMADGHASACLRVQRGEIEVPVTGALV